MTDPPTKITMFSTAAAASVIATLWMIGWGIFIWVVPSPANHSAPGLRSARSDNSAAKSSDHSKSKYSEALSLIAEGRYRDAKPILLGLTTDKRYERNAWRDYCNCCEGIYEAQIGQRTPTDRLNKTDWVNGLRHFKACLDPARDREIYSVVVSSLSYLASKENE